jgi:hypothetical protein
MSFLKKIKQGLGIGTVKLTLEVPPSISPEGGQIDGHVVIEAQSDQHITVVKVKLIEKYTQGHGQDEEKIEKEFVLGETSFDRAFDMKYGESRRIDFTLPYAVRKSRLKGLSEKKGALGTLGKVASFVGAEKSEYEVSVEAKLEGAMLSPKASKSVMIR